MSTTQRILACSLLLSVTTLPKSYTEELIDACFSAPQKKEIKSLNDRWFGDCSLTAQPTTHTRCLHTALTLLTNPDEPTHQLHRKELNLFGSGNLYNTLRRTQTFCGQARLMNTLAAGLPHQTQIQNRQQTVRNLLANPDACKMIRRALQQVRELEPVLFNWWHYCWAQKEILVYEDPSQALLGQLSCFIIAPLIPFSLYRTLFPVDPAIPVNYKLYLGTAAGFSAIIAAIRSDMLTKQETLMAFAKLSKIAKEMNWQVTESQQFSELRTLLEEPTFTGKPSFFSSFGNIEKGYSLLAATTNHFHELLLLVGELDLIVSLVTLIRDHQDSETPYCLVDFTGAANTQPTYRNQWALNAEQAKHLAYTCGIAPAQAASLPNIAQ